MSSIYPLLGIYLFIVVGFIAKKSFKDRIDEKSLVFLSIYFLQPFLVLWGFTTNQLDFKIIEVPIIFTLIISIFLFLAILVANTIFKDKQDRSIFIVTSIIANTGNLGIPLGLMLFGKESIIYTTFINIANIFLVYIVGVFFYSRGRYSVKESLLNIVKLPIIWFTTLAIVLNLLGLQYPKELLKPLEMGAYASMVLQLVIFGIYLNSVQISSIDLKMLVSSILFRFILVPTLSILILTILLIDGLVYKVLLLELIVPIAVNNVNLAALYSCKPKKVALLTFVSSVIFLFYFIWFAKGQLL
jgi:predicted permease